MQRLKRVLYAYAYNGMNDVYTVRGIENDEMTLEPRSMSHIPVELLLQMRSEYSNITKSTVLLDPVLSFTDGRYCAVVDFHGRRFTSEQVQKIIKGEIVDVPYLDAFQEKEPQKVKKPKSKNDLTTK